MSWTITHGATTQTVEEWGLSGLQIHAANLEPGTLSFNHVGTNFDGVPLFAYGDTVTLKRDAVTVFTGTVSRTPRMAKGNAESISYEVSDALYQMSRTTMQQVWSTGLRSLLLLFDNGAGESLTVAQTITALMSYATATCGIDMQLGTLTNLAHVPAKLQMRDVTILEALRACLRYAPDAVQWIDHSTTPPTLNITRRADASAASLAITEVVSLDIASRDDMVATAVVLKYVRNTPGSAVATEVLVDAAPSDLSNTPGAVVCTFDLKGQPQVQACTVDNVNEDSKTWWKSVLPWMAEIDNADFELSGGTTTHEKRLVAGAAPGWLPSSCEDGFATAIFSGAYLGQNYEAEPLLFKFTGTTLNTGLYSTITDGEAPPTAGAAAQLFAAWGALHHEGRLDLVGAEISTSVSLGQVLNLSGGHADWVAMRAVVQRVVHHIDSGTTSVEFGPPQRMGPQDFVAMLEQVRKNESTRASGERSADTLNNQAIGPAATPNDTESKGPASPPKPPLTAYGYGNGEWSVTAATLNGSPVTASDGTPLSDIPPPRGTHANGKIYLEVTASLTFDDGYLLQPTTISTVKVKAANTVPANTEPAATGTWIWNVELATLTDGVPSGNTFGSSLSAYIEDASDEDTLHAVLRTLRT